MLSNDAIEGIWMGGGRFNMSGKEFSTIELEMSGR